MNVKEIQTMDRDVAMGPCSVATTYGPAMTVQLSQPPRARAAMAIIARGRMGRSEQS
jgi:hypothetical protein